MRSSGVLYESFCVLLQQPSLPGRDSEKCSKTLGSILTENWPQSRPKCLDSKLCTYLWSQPSYSLDPWACPSCLGGAKLVACGWSVLCSPLCEYRIWRGVWGFTTGHVWVGSWDSSCTLAFLVWRCISLDHMHCDKFADGLWWYKSGFPGTDFWEERCNWEIWSTVVEWWRRGINFPRNIPRSW